MKTQRLEIKKLGINGEGIGYINRKITFVRGALPSEEVEVEITNETNNFKEGKLVKIIKPSKHRQTVPCFNQTNCLGCPIMQLSYEEQLYYKKDIIRDSLRKYTNTDIRRFDFRKTIAAIKLEGYKDTVHLPIVKFNDKVTFGIYQRETKYLTVMSKCGVQNPIINRCLNDLENLFEKTTASAYSELYRKGLRFLTIRHFNGKLQLIFVTGRDTLSEQLIELIGQLDYVESIYYTINTNKGQDFTAGRYHKVYGKTRQEFKLKSNKFIISPKSDFPINTSMVETVVDLVNKLIGERELSVLEINGGIGWLSLNLDEKVSVKGIEFNKQHIEDATLNAKFLRKDHCSYEFGKIDELVKTLTKNKSFDMFIVHAPRLGMRTSIKDSLIKGKIKEVIYLSSSPSSLAKDIGELEKYYQIESIIPVDDMPHSQNVQVIAKLKWRYHD